MNSATETYASETSAHTRDDVSPALVDWVAFLQNPTMDKFLRFSETPNAETAYIAFRGRQRRYGLFVCPIIAGVAYGAAAFEEGQLFWAGVAAGCFLAALLAAVLVAWPRPAIYACLAKISGITDHDVLFAYASETVTVFACGFIAITSTAGAAFAEDVLCSGRRHATDCNNFVFMEFMAPIIHILRPRLMAAIPILALQVLASIIATFGFVLYDARTEALLQVFHVVLVSIAAVVLATEEKADRERFLGLVHVQQAQREVSARQRVIDALTTAAIPPWALAKLRSAPSLAAAMSADSTKSASLGLCDVADFAHWSTGLLPVHVVLVLHRLFSVFDVAAKRFGVTKVATYADSYTVVLGMPGQHGATMPLQERQRCVETFVRYCVTEAVAACGLVFERNGSDAPDAPSDDEASSRVDNMRPTHKKIATASSRAGDIGCLENDDDEVVAAAASIADVAVPDTNARYSAAAHGPGSSNTAISQHASSTTSMVSLRGAVCSGKVTGCLSGAASSLRYVLSGAAIEQVRAALSQTKANQVTIVPVLQKKAKTKQTNGGLAIASSSHLSSMGSDSRSTAGLGGVPGTVAARSGDSGDAGSGNQNSSDAESGVRAPGFSPRDIEELPSTQPPSASTDVVYGLAEQQRNTADAAVCDSDATPPPSGVARGPAIACAISDEEMDDMDPRDTRDLGVLTALDTAQRDSRLAAERRKQYEFSTILLRFNEPQAEENAAAFATDFDAKAVPVVSICLAVLYATGVLVSLIQGLLPSDLTVHNSDGVNPIGLTCLSFACLGFAGRAGVYLYDRTFFARQTYKSAKVVLDFSAASLFLVVMAVGNAFFDITLFASVPSFLFFLNCVLPHLYQHTSVWIVAAVIQALFGQVSLMVSRLWLHGSFDAYVPYNYATAAVAFAFCFASHYLSRRRVKEHYAAGALAADLMTISQQNADLEGALLHTLLPKHAAVIAISMTHTADYQHMLREAAVASTTTANNSDRVGFITTHAKTSKVYSPHAQHHWSGLVVIRGRFVPSVTSMMHDTMPGGIDGSETNENDRPTDRPKRRRSNPWADDAADRWANLVAMVAAVCPNGELEIVEGFGDDFTVAGPFQRNNEAAPSTSPLEPPAPDNAHLQQRARSHQLGGMTDHGGPQQTASNPSSVHHSNTIGQMSFFTAVRTPLSGGKNNTNTYGLQLDTANNTPSTPQVGLGHHQQLGRETAADIAAHQPNGFNSMTAAVHSTVKSESTVFTAAAGSIGEQAPDVQRGVRSDFGRTLEAEGCGTGPSHPPPAVPVVCVPPIATSDTHSHAHHHVHGNVLNAPSSLTNPTSSTDHGAEYYMASDHRDNDPHVQQAPPLAVAHGDHHPHVHFHTTPQQHIPQAHHPHLHVHAQQMNRQNIAPNAPPTSLSAVAAVALLRELQTTVGFPGVQAAVTVGTAFSALLGGQLLSYRLFGPAVREAATVLDAGLLPAGSAVYAAPAFRRAHRGAFVTAPIPPPMPAMPAPTNAAEAIAAMHMSLSRAYAGSIMLQKTALPVASDVPPEGDATFGAPMRWRLKAAGVMMVSTVRL